MPPPSPVQPTPLFDIVLHEPEIPNNTGNIGRTCVATGCNLRLIHPIGFDTDEKACRRAGLDYWQRLSPSKHAGWDEYLAETGVPHDRLWLFTTKPTMAPRPQWDADLRRGDHLVFGKETAGLPTSLLERFPDRLVTLPMQPGERSINVATAVCAAIYEGLRQCVARNEATINETGRIVLHD